MPCATAAPPRPAPLRACRSWFRPTTKPPRLSACMRALPKLRKSLPPPARSPAKSSMSMTAAPTTRSPSRARCRRARSTSRWSRCRAISARRRRCLPASITPAKAHRDEESFLRRVAAKAFYALLNSDSHVQIPENAGDFRLLSPRAAKALRQMPERNRFFKGLASWIGFRQKRIDYEPAQRAQGRSSWGLRSLIGLSLNGLTAFSVAPLRMATVLGLLLALIALIYGGKIIYETVVYGASVPGYPSLFVGVMVLGAVQLVMLGVGGEYIGKILYEIKARPVYFVAEHDVKLRAEAAQSPPPFPPPLTGEDKVGAAAE